MPDREAQRRAQANNARIRAEAEARGEVFLSRALLSTTLFPGQDIRGAVFFEKKKFHVALFALEVGGTNFEFGVGPPDK